MVNNKSTHYSSTLVHYLIKDAITVSNYMIIIVSYKIYMITITTLLTLQVQIKVTITISDYMITL